MDKINMTDLVIPKKEATVKMRTSIFMPRTLRAQLMKVAKSNNTSLNLVLVHLLTEAVKPTGKIPKRKVVSRDNTYRASLYISPAAYRALMALAEKNGIGFNTLCLQILEGNFSKSK